jgi:hypothetical protein
MPKTATVTFNPHNQSLDTVHQLVATIINKSGCRTCGRLINLNFTFGVDPDPDLAKQGAIAVDLEGF